MGINATDVVAESNQIQNNSENDIIISEKKGIASWYYASGSNAAQRNVNIFNRVGATWFYNWGATDDVAVEANAVGLEYVPMVWGQWSVNENEMARLKAGKEAGLYENLLAFNEPDLSDQANMSVDKALELWPQLESTGLRLGSPAGAAAEDSWVEEFMRRAKEEGYRVDFLTLHIYQDFTHPGSVASLASALERLHNKYQIPIWITEIGNVDVSTQWWGYNLANPMSHQLATKYITDVTELLESLDYIERYAWFVDSSSNTSGTAYTRLFNTSNNTLTEEGEAYKNAGPKGEDPTITEPATEEPITAEPTTALETDSNLVIEKKQLALTNGLRFYFKADRNLFESDGYSDPTLVIRFNDTETVINDFIVEGNYYQFAFNDIAPYQMDYAINVSLHAWHNGKECVGPRIEYSVATYCYSILNDSIYGTSNAYARLRALLVDMLNYGAASQEYMTYVYGTEFDHLVNENLTETQRAWGTSELGTLVNVRDLNYETIENPGVTWIGTALNLRDSIVMRLRFQAASVDGLTVKARDDKENEWVIPKENIERQSGTTNYYYVYFDQFNVGRMSDSVYLTVYDGETPVSNTCRFSIESYAQIYRGNINYQTLSDLVVAMMKYGNAVKAYIS